MGKVERGALVAIVLAVALLLRAAFVATAVVHAPLRADAGEYAQIAANLTGHGTFSTAATAPPPPDAYRSPGYPLFLALCRWLAPGDGWYALARWLQVLLGTAAVLGTYLLARRWLRAPFALAAAALTALSPHLVVATGYVLTECLTGALLVGGLLGLTAGRRRRAAHLAGALLLGAAGLANEVFAPLPVLAALLLRRRLGGRWATVLLVVALLPIAAWWLRNQVQPLARTGAQRAIASLSHGSYPGMVHRTPRPGNDPYHEDPAQPGFGASWANLRQVLGERIAAAPWRYAQWYLLEKPLWLWRFDHVQGRGATVYAVVGGPYESQPVVRASQALLRALHAPVMALAAAALLGLLRRRRRSGAPARLCAAAVAYATLAYLPVIPDPRYLQPVRPLLFALAASAAAALAAALVRRRRAAGVRAAAAAPALE